MEPLCMQMEIRSLRRPCLRRCLIQATTWSVNWSRCRHQHPDRLRCRILSFRRIRRQQQGLLRKKTRRSDQHRILRQTRFQQRILSFRRIRRQQQGLLRKKTRRSDQHRILRQTRFQQRILSWRMLRQQRLRLLQSLHPGRPPRQHRHLPWKMICTVQETAAVIRCLHRPQPRIRKNRFLWHQPPCPLNRRMNLQVRPHLLQHRNMHSMSRRERA